LYKIIIGFELSKFGAKKILNGHNF